MLFFVKEAPIPCTKNKLICMLYYNGQHNAGDCQGCDGEASHPGRISNTPKGFFAMETGLLALALPKMFPRIPNIAKDFQRCSNDYQRLQC